MNKLIGTFTCNGRVFKIYQLTDKENVPIDNRYRCSVTIGHTTDGKTRQKNISGTTPDIVKYRVYSLFNVRYDAKINNNLNLTLIQCLNDWLDLHYKRYKSSSYEAVHYRINKVMGSFIDGIMLQDFSHDAAQELIYRLDEDYSGAVVHSCGSILKKCLDVHVERGDIGYNPCEHLWLPANRREKDIVPFTISEIQALAEEARKIRLDLLFLVCFYCAMRIGEVIALRWSDIKQETKSITIRSSVSRGSKTLGIPVGIQNSTKSNEPRTIYPPDVVFTYLEQAKKRQELQKVKAALDWKDKNFCFTTDLGDPYHYGAIRDNFKKCCKKIGRPEASTHYLRHTMASMLNANGTSITDISYQVGHSNSITTKTYLHPTEKSQERYRRQLNSISDEILGNE